MEDGGAGGDNHSDRDSDKLGNGIVYAMNKRQGAALAMRLPLVIVPLSGSGITGYHLREASAATSRHSSELPQ